MATLVHRIERRAEQVIPILLGAIAFGSTLLWGAEAIAYMKDMGWNVPSLYSSVFQLATVATAFLFTFYTLFLTTDRGFIGRAKDTKAYKRTIEYTVTSLLLGAVLAIVSILMILVNWTPTVFSWELAFVAGWVGLTVWAIATFARAAIVFAVFASEHR